MSFEFLAPGEAAATGAFAPVARSPMERAARAAGARFEVRDGWSVAVAFAGPGAEARTCRTAAGWADVSHLGKLELQAPDGALGAICDAAAGGVTLEPRAAARAAGAWWCPVTDTRALVVCSPERTGDLRRRLEEEAEGTAGAVVTEVTTAWAALTLVGPLAREVFARFCATDLRPRVTPVGGLRPSSIARQPGLLLREDEDRYLFLFGWAVAEYLWTVVEDAARRLGGAPVGVDALGAVRAPEGVRSGA